MDLAELQELGARERRSTWKFRLRCCTAAGCMSSDGQGVKDALMSAVKEAGLADQVHVAPVGCMRLCCEGPLVQVDPDGALYEKVTPADAASIVASLNGTGKATARQGDPVRPFFTRQMPIVLENSRVIAPERTQP